MAPIHVQSPYAMLTEHSLEETIETAVDAPGSEHISHGGGESNPARPSCLSTSSVNSSLYCSHSSICF
jgi:hypothetical protein